MKIAEIISVIEEIAPPACQADWDRSGLQVTCLRTDVKKLAVCLDPLPSAITQCLELGAEFILSHHPLTLKPALPNTDNNYFKTLKLLLSADAALYSAHTSLDINPAGPAGWLGRQLELNDCKILEYVREPAGCYPVGLGFGEIGRLQEKEETEVVCGKILSLLGLERAALCGPRLSREIDVIAYCGGSGASLIEEAWRQGAQLFITGDVKYHAALDAKLPVLDVGHFSIENEMMRHMVEFLQKKLRDIDIFFVSGKEPFRQIWNGR